MNAGIIQEVINGFSKIEAMDPTGKAYGKLCAILDGADNEALQAIYDANIKFASKLAFNRMIRRGMVANAFPPIAATGRPSRKAA